MILMLIASCSTSTGQLFWKLSESKDIKFLVIGFILYGIGALLMIAAFRFGSFSVLHPMLCLSYIFAIFLGRAFLKEIVNLGQIAGVIFIILGVVFIGGGDS